MSVSPMPMWKAGGKEIVPNMDQRLGTVEFKCAVQDMRVALASGMTPVCQLPRGHAGNHQDGVWEWTNADPTTQDKSSGDA